MNMGYFSYAIIAVGIFTAYMAVVHLFRRDRTKERLQTSLGDAYISEDEGAPPLLASLCSGLLSMLGVDVDQQKDTALTLQRAGIASPHAVSYYLCFQRIVQPILVIIGIFMLFNLFTGTAATSKLGKLFMFMVAALVIAIGCFGTRLYVANCKQRRQKLLLYSFPEVLDLLLVCIESGLGLDAALSRVCNEMRETHPDVVAELDRTRIELTVMSDRTQALQNLGERTDIVPFRSLVSSLVQTEKFGTSLLDTLRVLSDDMRTTRLMNAENRAARIPVLITIPLILCMLPAFIMIILGPPIVRVIEQGGIFGTSQSTKSK